MTSTQYDSDLLKMVEEVKLYLASTYCKQDHDSKVDAWVFDVDDTLLSTIPYFNSHAFGGEKLNETSLEAWMRESKAPALNYSLRLFHTIKDRGIKIFIISSRREHLRSATVDNLIGAGYHGWSGLLLRPESAAAAGVAEYKAEARKRFVEQRGYHILGIVGDQWSSTVVPEAQSNSGPFRAFKLPNPVYYVS
ncbi:Acid phosphatase 1 [Linum grandiflorum]